MNISKLIAKFILASFVFSSMQGIVLAEGGKTAPNTRSQEILNGAKNDPVIPGYLFKAPVKPAAAQNPTSLVQEPTTSTQNPTTEIPAEAKKETQTMFASLFARLPELSSKDELYAKLPSRSDLYAKAPSKEGLYNIFKETKDGVLKIVAKVTPESILKTKYGIEAVTFIVVAGTAYAIYYVGVKKGGFKKIQATLGSVANFVKSSPKTLAASAAAGLAALAYKTDAKTAAYVLGGAVALYGLKKLAGVAKNGIVSAASYAGSTRPGQFFVSGASSAKNLAVSAKDTVASGAKLAGSTMNNLVPSFVKTAGSKVVLAAKSAGSKLVSYVPFLNKFQGKTKELTQKDVGDIYTKANNQLISFDEFVNVLCFYAQRDEKENIWLTNHIKAKRPCAQVWCGWAKDKLVKALDITTENKNDLRLLVDTFFASSKEARQTTLDAIITFLSSK